MFNGLEASCILLLLAMNPCFRYVCESVPGDERYSDWQPLNIWLNVHVMYFRTYVLKYSQLMVSVNGLS